MSLPRYTLEHVKLPTESVGSWYDDRNLICKTLELPYRNNVISNDPEKSSGVANGIYILEKQQPSQSRPYGYFRFRAIAGRTLNHNILDADGKPMSSILVHRISYVKDLRGCIGVGGRFADLNGDGVPDIADSSKKLQWMWENLPDIFELEIKDKP